MVAYEDPLMKNPSRLNVGSRSEDGDEDSGEEGKGVGMEEEEDCWHKTREGRTHSNERSNMPGIK